MCALFGAPDTVRGVWAQYLFLPVFDLGVALSDGRVDVLHLQPHTERLFLQRVLLLL